MAKPSTGPKGVGITGKKRGGWMRGDGKKRITELFPRSEAGKVELERFAFNIQLPVGVAQLIRDATQKHNMTMTYMFTCLVIHALEQDLFGVEPEGHKFNEKRKAELRELAQEYLEQT